MFNERPPRSALCWIRYIIAKLRHDGCDGRAGRAELFSGIESVSNRPVRKIVLREA
jgi:hypothetical protein